MEPVGEGIREELRRLGADSSAVPDQNEAWLSAVGPEIARNAWPARTQADGTLIVHVRDAIWGFELSQQAPEEQPVAPPGPTPEQVREAAEMTASISDRELRESVAKVIKAALVRPRNDRPV